MDRQRIRLRGKSVRRKSNKNTGLANSFFRILFSAVSGIIMKDLSNPNSKIRLTFKKMFLLKNTYPKEEKRKIIKAEFEEIEGGEKNEKQD